MTMDLVMPVMGGLEALRQIRAIDPAAKVVVVTALDQKQVLMDSIRDGAIDFIVKPFERQRVLNLLEASSLESDEACRGERRKNQIRGPRPKWSGRACACWSWTTRR